MFLLLSNQPFKLSTVLSTKQNQREVKPLYFSWTLITLCTIGMSRPSTLKTTISPALIGSSRKFVRNRRSPLWKAGSMLPLERNTKSHQNYVHTRWTFQPVKNTTNIPLRISTFINSQAGLWAIKQTTAISFWLLKVIIVRKGAISSWIWVWEGH